MQQEEKTHVGIFLTPVDLKKEIRVSFELKVSPTASEHPSTVLRSTTRALPRRRHRSQIKIFATDGLRGEEKHLSPTRVGGVHIFSTRRH
jgi:hypothetical protein